MSSAASILEEYHATRRTLDTSPDPSAACITLLESHRMAALWAALDYLHAHLHHIEEERAKLIARSLIAARIDRLTPELEVILLDLLEQLLSHLEPHDLATWRWRALSTHAHRVRVDLFELLIDPDLTIERLHEDAPRRLAILAQLEPRHLQGRLELLELLRDAFSQHIDFHHELLTLCVEAVEANTYPLHRGRQVLLDALSSPSPALKMKALSELARPWTHVAGAPRERLVTTMRGLTHHKDERVVHAAITWLGHAHARDVLTLLFKDEHMSVAHQRTVMQAISECALARDIDDLLIVTRAHPMDLAPALFDTLLVMHHRGEYIDKKHVPTLIELFDELRPCLPITWHAITFTSRHHVLELLERRDHDDAAWGGHAIELLAHLEGSASLISALLQSIQDVRLLAELTRTARWLASEVFEPALLARCRAFPHLILPALVTCGGTHTREFLHTSLERLDTWILPHQQLAASILWHFAPDAHTQRELLDRCHPEVLPQSIRHVIPEHDDAQLAKLIAHAQSRASSFEQRMERTFLTLCQHASPSHLPWLLQTLCAIVSAMPDLHVRHDHARTFAEETTLDAGLIEAMQALGKRWYMQRRLRPACIHLATSDSVASHQLVNHLIMEILDGDHATALDPHHERILLSALELPLDLEHTRRLKSKIWTKDVHVRKVLVRVFAQSRDPGVMAWFRTLLERHDDIETSRQVLLALQERGDAWASVMVARTLEHRNMNIKLCAARTLAEIADARSVPRLIFWLGHHDHKAFRRALISAMKRALGKGWRAAIRASISQETSRRRELFLEQALKDHDLTHLTHDHDDSSTPYQDPSVWWHTMRDATPPQRAARFHELDDVDSSMPTEMALAHLDDVLVWCTDQAFAPHRASALRWVTRHASSASRPHRLVLIESVRSLPPLTHTSTLDRLDCLNVLGALLTVGDHVHILADARHAENPEVLTTQAIVRLTRTSPRTSHDTLVTAAAQALLTHDSATLAHAHIDALTPHRRVALAHHLASLLPDLDVVHAGLALDYIWTHAKKTPHRGLDPSEHESVDELLERLEESEDDEVLRRTLDALMRRRLSGELELALLAMMLEHPLLDALHVAVHIASLLEVHVHHDVVSAHLAHAPPESLDRIVHAATMLPDETLFDSIDVWLALWRRDDLGREDHARLDERLGRLDAMRLLSHVILCVERGELGMIWLLRGELVEGPLYERLHKALARHDADDALYTHLESKRSPFVFSGTRESFDALAQEARQEREHPDVHASSLELHEEYQEILHTLQTSSEEFEVLAALRALRHHEHRERTSQLVLDILMGTRSPRLRSAAWRTLRTIGARERYLDASVFLLEDDRHDVQCSAIKALGHARHEPAIPKLVARHGARDRRIRRLATEALGMMPEAARHVILKMLPRTRPDRREALLELLESLDSQEENH